MQGFDSLASWLFDTTAVDRHSLALKPACIYDERAKRDIAVSQLYFDAGPGIHQLSVPAFSFQTLPVSYKKLDTKHNIAGNTASGALTLFTGIQTNKKSHLHTRLIMRTRKGTVFFIAW